MSAKQWFQTFNRESRIFSTLTKPGVVCIRIRAVSRTSGKVEATKRNTIAKLNCSTINYKVKTRLEILKTTKTVNKITALPLKQLEVDVILSNQGIMKRF